MTSHRPLRFLLSFAAASVLAGCSLLPASQPLDVYRLPATPTVASAPALSASASATPASQVPGAAAPMAAARAPTIRVAALGSSQTLDSTKIAVIPKGDVLSSYTGARWSDPAPALLRRRLVEALSDGGALTAVGEDSGVRPDLELDSDLQAFQAEYQNGQPVVIVRLDARLLDPTSQRILATRRFEILERPSAPDVPTVVKAFGRACDQLGAQVSDWTASYARPILPR